ncbi:hypothetical protein [Nocardia brasiliensis]|uniref:hypothetical protein n=1 Tax=Nocardia brasiliensis TaxID=37326 RepID=UPI0003184378|nr:hypothetical protein [Nocardia brasiliensis]ASF06314.1 hypothetical protein CEQ30_02035 [Nocardia brasiliensis]SUB54017.1 Uncharacterised protein [Nocardia brasiliensis]
MAQQGEFGFVPLWPFRSEAEAVEWQAAYRTDGADAWHLDAELTALTFTREYLGLRTVDQVVVGVGRSDTGGDERFVGVGFVAPNGAQITAAVLHLARIGAGADAPWEVVGSDGGTLSVDEPGYGATVTSPLAVRGRITGVDESLTVQIRVHGSAEPVGAVSGIAAGGTDEPWSATVPFTAAPGSVLTIAVSTGGHIAEVEHFAVTGARH